MEKGGRELSWDNYYLNVLDSAPEDKRLCKFRYTSNVSEYGVNVVIVCLKYKWICVKYMLICEGRGEMMSRLKFSNIHVPPSCEMLTLYRMELMGLAAIWVICFHYFASIFSQWHMSFAATVMGRGNCGVDLFLFLSGIGLYNSLSRNDAVVPFYRRRIRRVVIPYLILSLPYWILQLLILNREGFNAFLIHWSGLSFWIEGDWSIWYVDLILMLYIVYPLIFQLQKRYGAKVLGFLWGGFYFLIL